MTREEAVNIIKSECYVFNPFNLDRSTMVNAALDMAIKALDQEPCEDAISRKSMLDYLKYLHGEMPEEEFVKALPSVTPARKKPIVHAHWDVIDKDSEGDEAFVHVWDTLCCSRCGMERTTEDGYIPQYCESCGAKMDE